MNTQNGKKLRVKRKKADLNERILIAAKREIIEKGFEKTRLMNILEDAKVQASVFYNRYENLDDLFDQLIRPYDYWLEDNIRFAGDTPIERLMNAINSLIDFLNEDPFLQQILIWEICSDNYLTHRTFLKRKLFFHHYLKQCFNELTPKQFDPNSISSFVIGGIYYFFVSKKKYEVHDKNKLDILKKQVHRIVIGLYDKQIRL